MATATKLSRKTPARKVARAKKKIRPTVSKPRRAILLPGWSTFLDRLPCPPTLVLRVKSSVPASSPIIILDAGPLKAAVDRLDAHNLWATAEMLRRAGPFIVTSAAVAEATHLLRNQGPALDRLRELVERMQVEDPAPTEVLSLMKRYAPEMDYADA